MEQSPLLGASFRRAMLQPAPSSVMTSDDNYDKAILGADWEDLEIEVTLDSGCVDHVMGSFDAPGYCSL